MQPTLTPFLQEQADKAANQGKAGYDVLGNPISTTKSTVNTDAPATPSPVMTSNASRALTATNTQVFNNKVASLSGSGVSDSDAIAYLQKLGYTSPDSKEIAGAKSDIQANGGTTTTKSTTTTNGTQTPEDQIGSTPTTNNTTSNTSNPIDDKYKKMADDYSANMQSQLDSAKTSFDSWKTSSDEIGNALIDGITKTFEASIAQMTEMNRQATARDTATGYSGGGGAARYAPQMNDAVISDTVQKGIMRINDLKAQEIEAIAKAKQAKNEDDIIHFNDYMKFVKDNNQAVTDELIKLSQQANADKNEIIQQAQEQRAQQKAQFADDAATAKNYAASISEQLGTLPDETAKKKFLEAMGKKLGIDPFLLESSALEYGATTAKDALSAENIKSQIADREEGNKVATYNAETSRMNAVTTANKANEGPKPTLAEKKSSAFSGINQLLSPDIQKTIVKNGGIPYVDSEGYITPEGFKAIVAAATEDGISRKEILDAYADQMYIEKGKASKYGLTTKETATYASSNSGV